MPTVASAPSTITEASTPAPAPCDPCYIARKSAMLIRTDMIQIWYPGIRQEKRYADTYRYDPNMVPWYITRKKGNV